MLGLKAIVAVHIFINIADTKSDIAKKFKTSSVF